MIPGECVGVEGVTCQGYGDHDPIKLELDVLRSGAGYYVGYFCPRCGPFSRESGYFATEAEAQAEKAAMLKEGSSSRS